MPGPRQNRSRLGDLVDRARWRVREYHAGQQDRPFYARNGFVVAAVFVGVVVVAGIVLLITLGRDDEPQQGDVEPATGEPTVPFAPTPTVDAPQDAVTSPPPDQDEATEGPDEAGGCPPLESDSDQDAVAAAPDVTWSPVGDAPTASTPADGPAITDGPKRCYAPTATGALLAAHNFTADGQNPNVDALDLAQTRVLPTASMYDQLIAEAGDARSAPAAIVPVAYRFISAEDDRYETAVVYQVSRASVTAYVEQRLTTSWTDGDWMIADGVVGRQISEVPPGYLAWGPLTGLIE